MSVVDPTALDEVSAEMTELQKWVLQFQSIKTQLDVDGDNKISAYELMIGILTVPKFLAIIFGLLSSLYGIYEVIAGFISDDWNTIGLLIVGILILSMIVFYFVIKKLSYSSVQTVKNLNTNHETRYSLLKGKYEDAKDKIAVLTANVNALIADNSLKSFSIKVYQAKHPNEKIPNIADFPELNTDFLKTTPV